MKRNILPAIALFASLSTAGRLGAQQLQFTVTPDNQPTDAVPAESMAAYSALNRRLAGAVAEPASSCLKTYATYQGCKAGDSPSSCGVAPSCTVMEPLPVMDLSGIRMNFLSGQDVAVLAPSHTKVMYLGQITGMPAGIKIINQDAAPPTAKPDPSAPATVEPPNGPIRVVQMTPPPAPQRIGPARISGGVIASTRISAAQPKYPIVARMGHMEGTVVLRAIISRSGTIENLEVVSTSNPIFSNSAIDAVRQWVYKPYTLNGQPTEVDTTVTVNYALSSPNKNPSMPTGPSQNGSPQFPQLGPTH